MDLPTNECNTMGRPDDSLALLKRSLPFDPHQYSKVGDDGCLPWRSVMNRGRCQSLWGGYTSPPWILGLIVGCTGSIDDMLACLGLIGALADEFVALRVQRGNLGRGGGMTFPRDAAAMAVAILASDESGAGFSGRWVFGDWLVTAAAMAFPV